MVYFSDNNDSMRSTLFSAALCILLFACKSPDKPLSGIPPEKAISTFELPKGFKIELVAAEPMVADPVAMEVDESGNIYVLEMHGYPLDKSGSGVVKMLTDTNGDGFPDKSTVFADKLTLPSGILRWKKGVLVVDVPNIIYLEDSTGDGIADIKKTVLSGFALSNPQHNANTPVYGLDNWIYIAHEGEITPKIYTKEFGDTGAIIRFPGNVTAPTLPRNANNRNVRFKPDSYELEMLSGETQYGQTFDTWGHHFLTSNANHIFHEAIQARYLSQNPNLLIADATQDIPDHGDAAEVFPITKNPQHQLLTDVGVITSSCGITWYQGGLFPDSFNNVTFIAEPVHNLVHADKISGIGTSYNASRLYNDREFLASTDPWFRPVQFYIGPDGALYVIDYYRQIIEHPEWMSEEIAKSGALYNGSNQGRIYRITPDNAPALNWNSKLTLNNASIQELVKQLSNPNIWWRRNAQRLLVDKQDPSAIPLIKELLDSTHSSIAIVHALWTLEGLKAISKNMITKLFKHPEAGVRENAIRIAELHMKEIPELENELVPLYDDKDPKVRYQLLCTLGLLDSDAAESAKQFILLKDVEDKWIQIAALASSPGKEWALMEKVRRSPANVQSEGRQLFFINTGAVIGLSRQEDAMQQIIRTATVSVPKNDAWWKAALLEGMIKGLSVKGFTKNKLGNEKMMLLALFKADTDPTLRRSSLRLLQALGITEIPNQTEELKSAKDIAIDQKADPQFREDAILLLSLIPGKSNDNILANLITPTEPENVQKIAVRTFIQESGPKACNIVLAAWKQLTPGVRDEAMDQFMESTDNMQVLLNAVQRGDVQPSTIGWRRMVDLMNNDDPGIRGKSRKLLASVTENRDEAYKKYEPVLKMTGDAGKGSVVFQKNCAICHQMGGASGTAYGPDLASIRNRELQFILADIINPNRSIADGFENWTITLPDGKKEKGIISNETPSAITLKDAGGKKRPFKEAR
jgi:putative membrane-bound dehydrogenase-like protein